MNIRQTSIPIFEMGGGERGEVPVCADYIHKEEDIQFDLEKLSPILR